jgi:endonuclease YncB( thermonuclease family)
MRAVIALLVYVVVSPSLAAETIIHDGDSLTQGVTRYRLDGIDAPELDQVCLDEKGEVWACGIATS